MEQDLIQRLRSLETRYRNLQRSFAVLVIVFVTGFFMMSFSRDNSFDIIRAKGIVIHDSVGRDRILIGAPIPYSRQRVRTDTALVRKHWANRFPNPDQYMKWYSDYKNTADGMVVMNENGFDIVQLGDNLADPNIGKRMFKSSGLLWNNQTGWERGGAGVNTGDDGKDRPVIGLDDDSGEALHLVALEDGSKALIIGSEHGSLRIGMAGKDSELFQNKGQFTGIKFFDPKGKLVWEQEFIQAVKK